MLEKRFKKRIKIGVLEGVWLEDQMSSEVKDEYRPILTPEQLEVAEERFNSRKKRNPFIYDGSAMHLFVYFIKRGHLFLQMGRFKYSQYDIARQEYKEKFGWEKLPTGIGINTIILTCDKKIPCHKRFAHVDHRAKIGTIGAVYDGKDDPFPAMLREIREELGIEKEEIKKIILLGISKRIEERQNHELSFLVRTSLSKEEIIEREKGLEEKEGELFFLKQDPREVKKWLMNKHEEITSSSLATFVLAGRHLWGEEWSKIEPYEKD